MLLRLPRGHKCSGHEVALVFGHMMSSTCLPLALDTCIVDVLSSCMNVLSQILVPTCSVHIVFLGGAAATITWPVHIMMPTCSGHMVFIGTDVEIIMWQSQD